MLDLRFAALSFLLVPLSALAAGNSVRGKVTVGSAASDPGPAVVYVTGFTAAKAAKDVEVVQKGETFLPSLVPVVQGQAIRFLNQDSKSHNVFSNSNAAKFDLGTTDPGAAGRIVFSKPGLVDVFCNIHPSMEMRVLVLPNPAFALVSSGKEYSISGIPDGRFKIFAWHPRGKPVSKELELRGGQAKTLDWELDASLPETPHLNKFGKPYRDKSY